MTPRALDGYTAYADGWKENLGAGKLLRAIALHDVERHFALRAEAAAVATLNRERWAMRSFLDWARKRKWLEEDPMGTITHKDPPKRTIRALTDAEAEALLEACSRPYTVTKTGTRQGSEEVTTWEQRTSPPHWLQPAVMLLWKTPRLDRRLE